MRAEGLVWEQRLCKFCGNCAYFCPLKNLKIENNNLIIGEKCSRCGICAKYCPEGCLEIGRE